MMMNFKEVQKRFLYSFMGIVMLLIVFQPSLSQAQLKFDITPSYGFALNTNVRAAQGELVIKDGPMYGLTIDIGHPKLPGGVMIQLMYNRQDTQLDLKEWPSGTRKKLFDMAIEYLQIGIVRPLQMGKVQPFGIVGIGAASFSPDDTKFGTEWLFAAHLGGGAKIFLSESIGVRLQGRILLPMSFGGGGLWCGTGGCSVGVGSYSTFVQFDFNAGIVISLGGKR
jgi:hypothetical protein